MKQSVPVKVAARIYGKDPVWVRAGIISGWLPIGYATRNGKKVTDVRDIDSKKGRINYYISPWKLFEDTGYMWVPDKTERTIPMDEARIIFRGTKEELAI